MSSLGTCQRRFKGHIAHLHAHLFGLAAKPHFLQHGSGRTTIDRHFQAIYYEENKTRLPYMSPQSRHIRHLVVASQYGADPNSHDNCGRAPLHRVSHGGQLVIPVVSRLRGSSRGEPISTH